MPFIFQAVDKGVVEATTFTWKRQLRESAGEVPDTRYLQALEWAARAAARNGSEPLYVYALLREGEASACALIEISHALAGRPDAWLKVLRIHVEPRLDAANGEVDPRELARIASRILTEALQLTFESHPSIEMKVWGDTPLTRDFMEAICASLDGELEGFAVSTHGNWLVVSKSTS